MENSKADLYVEFDRLIKQALEWSAKTPLQVAEKLIANVNLSPSWKDFDSDYEWLYRLDENDNSKYPEVTKLIEDMRQTRKDIYNLKFAEQQDGPKDTMTC